MGLSSNEQREGDIEVQPNTLVSSDRWPRDRNPGVACFRTAVMRQAGRTEGALRHEHLFNGHCRCACAVRGDRNHSANFRFANQIRRVASHGWLEWEVHAAWKRRLGRQHSIPADDRSVRRGYATAGTDDGHEGGNGAAWAIGHPEKLIDFGYRAVHETSVQAKAIVRAFYGRDIQKSRINWLTQLSPIRLQPSVFLINMRRNPERQYR